MNSVPEMMKVWVQWQNAIGGDPAEDTFEIPEMDDDAVEAYLNNMTDCVVKVWDYIEECGSCGHLATKTMWDKGKVDCCTYCYGCDEYKPSDEDWIEDDDGDCCPDCQKNTRESE